MFFVLNWLHIHHLDSEDGCGWIVCPCCFCMRNWGFDVVSKVQGCKLRIWRGDIKQEYASILIGCPFSPEIFESEPIKATTKRSPQNYRSKTAVTGLNITGCTTSISRNEITIITIHGTIRFRINSISTIINTALSKRNIILLTLACLCSRVQIKVFSLVTICANYGSSCCVGL